MKAVSLLLLPPIPPMRFLDMATPTSAASAKDCFIFEVVFELISFVLLMILSKSLLK